MVKLHNVMQLRRFQLTADQCTLSNPLSLQVDYRGAGQELMCNLLVMSHPDSHSPKQYNVPALVQWV